MSEPSIKGTGYQGVHDDIHRLLESGRISREELEVRLEPADLGHLAEKVGAATWYPIKSYERQVELLVELEGGGDRESYLMGRGARAAERLSAAGIYQQLDASTAEFGPRVGSMIVSLAGVIYNFGQFDMQEGDRPGCFTVSLENAAALPEVSRFTTQGFMQYVATRVVGVPVTVESSRPSPDRVVFSAHPS